MSCELPALPAAGLAPAGHTMSAAEIRDWLTKNGAGDPEVAHGIVDDLMRGTLEAIRDGHPDPVGLATAALLVDSAEFPRWYA